MPSGHERVAVLRSVCPSTVPESGRARLTCSVGALGGGAVTAVGESPAQANQRSAITTVATAPDPDPSLGGLLPAGSPETVPTLEPEASVESTHATQEDTEVASRR